MLPASLAALIQLFADHGEEDVALADALVEHAERSRGPARYCRRREKAVPASNSSCSLIEQPAGVPLHSIVAAAVIDKRSFPSSPAMPSGESTG